MEGRSTAVLGTRRSPLRGRAARRADLCVDEPADATERERAVAFARWYWISVPEADVAEELEVHDSFSVAEDQAELVVFERS